MITMAATPPTTLPAMMPVLLLPFLFGGDDAVADGALAELEGMADEDAVAEPEVPVAELLEVAVAYAVARTSVSLLTQPSATEMTIITCSIRILAIERNASKRW